jgi:LmbE family N-acetylglucosaminyl deacetylase
MRINKFYNLLFLFVLLLTPVTVLSQQNLTILCVAAHPDDEDGATLAYYSKLKGYKAYTVFYTRGEGGQNEIGPELYDELGRIREQECKDAAEIQGSTPLFLGELDFGYSKTAKETFKFWGGKDSVLERIVYLMRKLRPDVVISNHDTITTKPLRQHGNHQAAGITIFEAFDKASDPTYHPEQFENGITPWQIKKLYFRVYDTTRTGNFVTIDISQKDETGKTIEDIMIDGLSKHRTQGMDKIDWKHLPLGFREHKYELVRSEKDYPYDESDLFSGITPEAKPDFHPVSYQTVYHYYKLSPEDSLRILKSIKLFKNNNFKIGLVETYDNTLQTILDAFNVKYDLLDSLKLANADLKEYNCIILDIRAYFYRTDLVYWNSKIMDCLDHGREVICFYHKPGDWNRKNFAPYPIYLTSERVTEEDATVIVLDSNNIIFRKPNKISDKDWGNWVQERSIYLPSSDTTMTSSKYRRLLTMHDEDDTAPPTSILVTYSPGIYTYVSLALYRQLKTFNEGALKLFFNILYQSSSLTGERLDGVIH